MAKHGQSITCRRAQSRPTSERFKSACFQLCAPSIKRLRYVRMTYFRNVNRIAGFPIGTSSLLAHTL